MPIVRACILGIVLALLAAGPLQAVTPDELTALSKAGLGDEVLLALIESTGVDRVVDARGALALKKAGVSDRVIAAAVRASNVPAEPLPDMMPPVGCAGCESNVAVIGAGPTEAPVPAEVVYVPWIWPSAPVVRHGRATPYFRGDRGFGRFINDGFVEPAKRRR